ncbi:MAG: outer membrane protein beta-barrel protein [Mucilaginibacter sp.]|nr:outer membrane protein beta-barrel protein [Mucilaginibacter sp.]
MLSTRSILLLIIVLCTSISATFAQTEDITSRFYFPGSIGVNVPFENIHTRLNNGLAVNTAIEYRPTYINDIFFRIDYDALNNNYMSYVPAIPTNILKGKLSTDFLLAGAGYRRKFGRWGLYGLIQPGLGIHSFERAVVTQNSILLNSVSSNSLALKTDIGLEYYITRHFAAVINPSYYKLFSNGGFNTSHSTFTGFNIGITTTIL